MAAVEKNRKNKARVDIRTTAEIRNLIEQAANLQGLTITEYAKAVLGNDARRVCGAAWDTPSV